MSEYIMSCNLKKFDVIEHFRTHTSVIWKQAKNCENGDIIYIYLGTPYSKLGYKCKVISAHLTECHEVGSIYQKMVRNCPQEYMKLELLYELPNTGLSLATLRDNGLKTVQCTTKVSDELHDYISSVIKTEA